MAAVYLDWNATTPLHEDALAAMRDAAESDWGNPSSVHGRGRSARARIESLRESIASLFEADPREVILTSGGTEANNLGLAGARGLALGRIEHPSVTRVAEYLESRGAPIEWLPVGPSGRIDPDAVAAALGRLPAGSTVALMAANHETGVLQPVHEVFALCRAAGARLHVDAVQAVGKLDPELYRRADSMALSAHKIRGPKGIGALVWRGSAAELTPLMRGGAQERGLRPGTQDAVAAAGFEVAIRRAAADGPARHGKLAALRDRLERELGDRARVNAAGAPRLAHVSNLFVPGWMGDELVAALDLAGVQVSSGSACSAGSAEPSPVLTAMLGEERARGSIRVSLGEATRAEDVARAIDVLLRLLTDRA